MCCIPYDSNKARFFRDSYQDSILFSLLLQVADVEHAILARKGEVEKLIADMKSANLESLTISPPEETKAFLDGRFLSTLFN